MEQLEEAAGGGGPGLPGPPAAKGGRGPGGFQCGVTPSPSPILFPWLPVDVGSRSSTRETTEAVLEPPGWSLVPVKAQIE